MCSIDHRNSQFYIMPPSLSPPTPYKLNGFDISFCANMCISAKRYNFIFKVQSIFPLWQSVVQYVEHPENSTISLSMV